MTRELAIEIFKKQLSLCFRENDWYKALTMAIKALQTEPYFWEKCPYYIPDIMFDGKEEYDWGKCTYKTEPCKDAISRTHLQITLMDLDIDHVQAKDGRELIQILDDEPPVQPEQKPGYWIPCDVSSGRDSWQCSVCGRRARGKIKNLPYCHCGAKMEEGE